MSFQVGGENGFDDDEPESLEVGVVEVGEPREPGVGLHQTPGGRRVVVLQHRAVVVQHRLAHSRHETTRCRIKK